MLWLLNRLALAGPALMAAAPSPDSGRPAGWAFYEPFRALDPDRWESASWTLGDTQLSPSQVAAVAGNLKITLADRGGSWTGGEVYAISPSSTGRYEAWIKVPVGGGSICAFFLYGVDDEGEVHEIDVELLSSRPEEVWFGTYADWLPEHGYSDGPTRQSFIWTDVGFDATDWHLYSFVWEKGHVAFEVDGSYAGAVSISPSWPMSMRLNHWTSTTWTEVGGPPASALTCRYDGLRHQPFEESPPPSTR